MAMKLSPAKILGFILLAMWEAFAFAFRFSSSELGSLSWRERIYQAFRDDGLLLALLVVVFFLMWAYLTKKREVSLSPLRNKTAAFIAFLFSLALLLGRAFTVNDIGIGTYGDIAIIIGDGVSLILSVFVLCGLWTCLYGLLLLAFEAMRRIQASSLQAPLPASEGYFGESDLPSSVGASDESNPPLPEKPSDRRQSQRVALKIRNFLETARPWQFALLLALCWLPYVIVYFPGCIYHDSADQLCQFFGVQELAAHHPLLSTYIFGGLVSIGKAIGSDAFGVFLCTLFQTAVLSFACGNVLCTARTAGKSRGWKFALGGLLLFVIVPLWGSAATSIKKDALFYAAFALFTLALFRYIVLKPQQKAQQNEALSDAPAKRFPGLIPIAFWGLITALARNDGFIYVACALLCFGLYALISKSGGTRRIIPTLICALVVISAGYLGGYKMIALPLSGATSGAITEALTIPIQQVARYYIEAPDDVTAEMEAGISRVINTDGLNADVYNPLVSDNIKFNYTQDDIDLSDLLAFFSAYIQMGIEHPILFLEAFIDQTSGWWYPELLGKPDWTVGNMGLYQNWPKVEIYEAVLDIDMPVYYTTVGQAFLQLIGAFGYIPGIGLLVYPAIYLWLLIVLAGYLWITRRRRDLILLIPLFLYFAICIASPVNGLTRYAVPIITCMPMILAWILTAPRSVASGLPAARIVQEVAQDQIDVR